MYCSRQCNEKARGARYRAGRVWKYSACENCGGSLFGKHTQARFCSVQCANQFHNAAMALERQSNRRPCVNCGTPIGKHRQRFCSDECKRLNRRAEAYGLKRTELDALLAQHGVCGICGTDQWGRKGPQVDHDHSTGKVRGILCISCNNGLGRFRDDPQRLQAAINYLS